MLVLALLCRNVPKGKKEYGKKAKLGKTTVREVHEEPMFPRNHAKYIMHLKVLVKDCSMSKPNIVWNGVHARWETLLEPRPRKEVPSPAAIRERAWAGDNTTSSFIPSTNVPCKQQLFQKLFWLTSIWTFYWSRIRFLGWKSSYAI